MVILENVTARTAVRIIATAMIGYVSMNGDVGALVLLPLVAWIWRASTSRKDAFITLFVYYLAAGRGLLSGACVFFSNPFEPIAWWAGLLVWLLPSFILAATWALLWAPTHRGLRLLVILLVISVPPIGLIGWASLLTAAGALFPGASWIGLFLTVALLLTFATAPRPCFIFPFLVVSCFLNLSKPIAQPPTTWMALNTSFSPSTGSDGEFERMQSLQRSIFAASKKSILGTTFLLPEAVGGDWAMNVIWWDRIAKELEKKQQTVVIGARRPDVGGDQFVNMLVSLGQYQGIEFDNRVPVPIGMWTPFKAGSAKANWWSAGVSQLGNQRVASVVCYEQLLVWPVLLSMKEHPDVLIGASNHWWARGTRIPEIQEQMVGSWGRLFNVPTVYATNR